MITPKEIHDKEFKRSLRGYDLDDVDQFLDIIIKDLEQLYKENASLKEEVDKTAKKISQYGEMESNLNRALLLAEKTAENVRIETMAEKEKILNEAKDKATQIIEKAKEDAKSFNSVNLNLIEKSEKFRSNLVELFEKQIASLKEFNTLEETINFKSELQKEENIVEEKEIVTIPTSAIFEETIKQESQEDSNGLLDDEDEEFKNKVFKFLEK